MQYDGKGKLGEAIAGLYGCPPKSHNKIARLIAEAKAALSIDSKAKVLPDDVKLAIYQWHWGRLNPAQGAGQPTLNGTGAADGLSPLEPLSESDNTLMVAIDPQPMPQATKPQHGGNWGGVRQGSGRKATGKQTVTVRVPVELAGFIKQLKGIGDTQGQAALLTVISGLESALHDSRHTPKA